jgi:hypothetical protein
MTPIKSRKVLHVFLASPGDMQGERRYARNCVDEWNQIHSDRHGWSVELMGWEDTLPQAGRPQETINAEIKKCHLFIGMMYRHWGSDTGNGYTSGFHEEFELALDLHGQSKNPTIHQFFKRTGSVVDPGVQLQKVIDFKQKVIAEKKVLFQELSDDEAEWQREFRVFITKAIFKRIDEVADIFSDDGDSVDAFDGAARLASQLPVIGAGALQSLGHVHSLISNYTNDLDVPSNLVARLRLIGTSWSKRGLSETFLWSHDANQIFMSQDFNLSQHELIGLIESGLHHYESQTVPLWRWIKEADPGLDYVRAMALYGADDAVSAGAYAVLSAMSVDMGALDDEFGRQFHMAKGKVKNSALSYIGGLGSEKYLNLANLTFEEADSLYSPHASLAIVEILSKRSLSEAVEFILSSNAPVPSGWHHLRDGLEMVDDEVLARGLYHRDSGVRAASVREASARESELVTPLLKDMRGDPSPSVRGEAVLAALSAGEDLTLSDIEKIIVRKNGNSLSMSSDDGLTHFDQVRAAMLMSYSVDELEKLALDLYSPSEKAYEILLERQWKQRSRQARHDVTDKFRSFYDDVFAHYRNTYGEASSDIMLRGFKENLKEYRQNEMLRAALNVISRKSLRADISLIRTALDHGSVSLNNDDLKFFSKHGEWSDIGRLSSARREHIGPILSGRYSISTKDVAETMLHLGRDRLEELLNLDIGDEYKKHIIVMVDQSRFAKLSNDFISSLFDIKSDDVRRVAVIKAVRCLTKKRCQELLDVYIANDYYYYNVFHWLDLAVSQVRAVVHEVSGHHLKIAVR